MIVAELVKQLGYYPQDLSVCMVGHNGSADHEVLFVRVGKLENAFGVALGKEEFVWLDYEGIESEEPGLLI